MAQTSRTFSDLDLDFGAHPITGDVLKRKDIYAIAGSLKNLLMTSHYERLFNPSMGGNLRKILFEPIDVITASLVRDEISLTIKNYEPRVDLKGIEVIPDYDNQQYDVTLTFFIANNPEPISISVFLERVR